MAQCEAVITRAKSPNVGKRCQRNSVNNATLCAVHGGIEQVGEENIKRKPGRMGVRCSEMSRHTGEPCGKYAIHGSTVCPTHGGQLPNVQKAAKQRLLALVDPALAELQKIIDKSSTADADRLKAIQMVLDRTGYHAKTEMTIEAEIKPWEKLVNGTILRDLPEGYVVEDVVDAEVVEDERAAFDVSDYLTRGGAEPEPTPDKVVAIHSASKPPLHLR